MDTANAIIDQPYKGVLARHIRECRLRSVFQPIVDLVTGQPLGYEVLSRGEEPLEAPVEMFRLAKEECLLWDLEKTCRATAFQSITALDDFSRHGRFFINVSPDIFNDPRFKKGFTLQALRKYGLNPQQIVIEITEETSFTDSLKMEAQIQHYADQGFQIALDDFGAGSSSLGTLIAVSPHFLKLDKLIVRDIHKHAYKQQLVRSFVSFASSVETKLIAEGIETWAEMESLLRLGIRYGQGFLLGRPASTPQSLTPEIRDQLAKISRRHTCQAAELDETIRPMVIRPRVVQKGSMSGEDVDLLFKRIHSLTHLVVMDNNRPLGLLTRQHFYGESGGPFGYSLFQKKPIEAICKRNPLMVEESMRITSLAKLAMERLPQDMYDPVLVISATGEFCGSVTIKQILTRATDLEVNKAIGANPLTGLPGNRTIQKWLNEVIDANDFTVIYADLDRFKEFNDSYGFMQGDELLRLTSQVLSNHLEMIGSDAMLGHIGGDDFVIVTPNDVTERVMHLLCQAFDHQRNELFRDDDVERGYYTSVDRKGEVVQVPLVTLSLAVITRSMLNGPLHPGMFGQIAASLKKKIKLITADTRRSGFLVERRQYQNQ